MENKHNFKIKFDKQENSISADTYVQSLVSLSTIIREVNYQIGTGPGVKVNVVAEQPGSFDVVLQIAEAIQDNYEIVMASAGTLAGIVGTAVGILQLKKMSKESDLTKTEIHGKKIIEMKDTNIDDKIIVCALNILLGSHDEFKYHFNSLSEKGKSSIRDYPIYNLIKSKVENLD